MKRTSYALVTGASRGLGKSFARTLAVRRQNLVLVARSKDKLDALASELSTAYAIQTETLECDLSAPMAGRRLAEQLSARSLSIDLLINNAGFGLRGEFLELPLARQLEMVNLQNSAVVELTFNLLPAMIEERHGGIINVSSMAGFQPIPYAALYSATKSFLTSFSMALREEVRHHGVTIVTVCPGRLRADPEAEPSQEKRQKFPGGEQNYEEVVQEALKKFDSGGGLVIPGRMNRLTALGQRLIPPNAVPKIVAKMSKKVV